MKEYNTMIISLIFNIILLWCLLSPNIVYIIHKKWFNWKSNDIKSVNNNEIIDEWLKYQQNKKNKWENT